MTAYPRATRRGLALDWVKFDAELARDGSVDPVDKALYAAIGSFVDAETRESPAMEALDPNNVPPWVPTRKRLAECIGKSVDTVDRSTKRLESLGLLKVHRQPDPTNPRRMLPSEYELLDHHVWDERAAQRAADRAAGRTSRRSEGQPNGVGGGPGGGRTGAATPDRTDAATPGRMGAADKDLQEGVEEVDQDGAPAARSAGDGRRPSAGSSASGARGGSAAAGKTRSSARARLTPEQAKAVTLVEDSLPENLVEALRGKNLMGRHLPASVRQAIVKALADRTAEQLVDRVARRWVRHGYAKELRDGKGLASPLGVVHALVRAGDCPDLGCEDGVMLDTRADCRACEGRKDSHRRGERKPSTSMPRQRQAVPSWTCTGCYADSFTPAPEELQCPTCAAKTQAAFRELAARLQVDALLIDTPDRYDADGVPWGDEEPPDPDEPDYDPHADEQAPQGPAYDDATEEANH